MNWLVWNCRGAGKRHFPANIKDYVTMYRLDFIAILEPRVSGAKANEIIQKMGLVEGARVEANGFSGGIWCLWRPSCPPMQLISSSRYYIHLRVNPQTPNCWVLSIVYASPHRIQREDTWQELIAFHGTISEPWCLVGDFNQILYTHEKEGGVPFSPVACSSFTNCINRCHLVDLGYKGHPFTWKRGDLKERLDRVLCTTSWQALFPNCSNTHLPLMSFDHCGLWVRNSADNGPRQSYFKFLAPWLEYPDFRTQVQSSWVPSDSCSANIQRLTKNLQGWNRDSFGHIFKRKQRLIRRLEGIGNVLLREDNPRLVELRSQLWKEYNQLLMQEETYWY